MLFRERGECGEEGGEELAVSSWDDSQRSLVSFVYKHIFFIFVPEFQKTIQ